MTDACIIRSFSQDFSLSIFLLARKHIIILIKLEFVRKYPFKKYGPDGTGEFFYSLNILENGHVFIKSFQQSSIFEINGKKSRKVEWSNSIDSLGNTYGETPNYEILVDFGEPRVFGVRKDRHKKEVIFDILSIADKSVKSIKLKYPSGKPHIF
jgi:hypothetical protein